MNNSYKTNRQHLVKHNYLSSKTNYVICIHITTISKDFQLLCVLDFPARNIVAHCFKKPPLNVQDVIQTLSKAIEDRHFLPKIQIIHSGKVSIFKNETYCNFVDSHAINISRASCKGHTNQVIERTFRTIKDLLKNILKYH